MRFLLSTALLAASASAHYTFPALIVNGQSTGLWQYVRKTANYQSNGPVTDVNSNAIRCYELSPGTASQTYEVKAGDTIGFTAAASISHPGPLAFYLAKAPGSAASFDGSGKVWFKIYEQGATISSGGMGWASNGTTSSSELLLSFPSLLTNHPGKSAVTVKLPNSLPSGEYLFRVEHIGLHGASGTGGAQFYIVSPKPSSHLTPTKS